MKGTFCLFSFLICAFCFAQEKVNADENIYIKIRTLEEVIYTTNLQDYYRSTDKIKSEFAKEIITQLWQTMLENCDELISRFPNSEYLFETLYEKASLEEILGDVKHAKETYEKVLSFKTSKTALKNKSLRAIAYILIEEKQYDKALVYLDQIKNFKISYDCGVPYEGDKKSLEIMYQKCYKALGVKQ